MSLYDFIQSMSRAEKRYFKMYAQTGKKSPPKYVHLFDLMNKQETYKEEAIRAKGFTSDDKNLLTEKLLDTVHIMQLHKSVDSELRLILDYLSVLYEKGHWQLMSKYVRKGKQIAKENERFDVLLELLKWEQSLLYKTAKTNFEDKTNQIIEEKERVLRQFNNEQEYYNLTARVDALLVGDAKINKSATQEKFNQLINSPLLHKNAKPLSKKAMIDYCYLKVLDHRSKREYKWLHSYYKLIINLFNKNKFLFYLHDYTVFYVKIYFWEKGLSIKLNKAITSASIQIDNLPESSIHSRYNIHLQSLVYCIKILNYNEGKQLILKAEQEWGQYTKYVKETRLAIFSYTIMIFYCLFEDWENAKIWLDKVIAVNRVDDRKDVQIAARLWQLIICYERTPIDLDKYTESAYRYLVRNGHYFEVEQQTIWMFRELYKAITYDEKKIVWQQMIEFIDKKLQEEAMPQRGLENLQLWCKSKVTRVSTIQLIQQQKTEDTFMYI